MPETFLLHLNSSPMTKYNSSLCIHGINAVHACVLWKQTKSPIPIDWVYLDTWTQTPGGPDRLSEWQTWKLWEHLGGLDWIWNISTIQGTTCPLNPKSSGLVGWSGSWLQPLTPQASAPHHSPPPFPLNLLPLLLLVSIYSILFFSDFSICKGRLKKLG